MDDKTYSELLDRLKEEFLLFKRGRLYAFLGGAITFLVAAGFISYQSVMKEIESRPAEKILVEMKADSAAAKNILRELESAATRYREIELGAVDAWKEILKVEPQSAIKIVAYTTENQYVQPWEIYLWKAYEEQNAGLVIAPEIPEVHVHSKAVEWEILGNGTLRIKKTNYDTYRGLKIVSIELLRGQYRILADELVER